MDIGVVIGRFQIPELTDGHLYLINQAFSANRRVLILVGSASTSGTVANPLDYPTRERMIRARFPEAVVLPLQDVPSNDILWSTLVDAAVMTVYPRAEMVTLFAGRDSFAPHYKGQWPVIICDSGIEHVSGTAKRAAVGKVVLDSADFRRGIIYATQNPPKVSP